MDMDYKPNSHKYKEEQNSPSEKKKVEKVVSGKVKKRKKSGVTKFADVFVSSDVADVKSHIFMEIIVPAMKKAIDDVVTDGIGMILYGESKGRKRSSNANYVSYRDYSSKDRRDDRYTSNRTRAGYNYDDIVLDSRGEAEEVLERMDELIDKYGIASVADMYDLVGITDNYTDNKYGWTTLRSAEVVRVRDGYMIKLPRPKAID